MKKKMKKKILSVTFVVAMMAVAGYNVYMKQNKKMPLTALANIEALANPEGETILTCGTHYEFVNYKKKCEGDHLYSEGKNGVEHSQTTGTNRTYYKGFNGIIYVCTSSSGLLCNDAKEYECGKDEFSNIFFN